jgi:DNA repair exonuclease SbcCD ATPase subunit
VVSTMGERLGQFERTVQTSMQTTLQASSGGSDRLAGSLAERLKTIEDTLLTHQVEVGQSTASLTAEMQSLARDVRGNAGVGDRIQALVGGQLQSFASNFDRQGSDIVTAIASPLSQRMASLSTEVQAQNNDMLRTVAQITDKLSGMEKALSQYGQRTVDTHTAHGRDLIEVHEALVKLNNNQQTLAASMDQWRLDTNNDLGFMSTRMEGLEKNVAKPVQMLESLSYNVQTLQRTTVKREEQRSRFRQWLMGTDDWYAASWEQNGALARNNGATHVQGSVDVADDGRPLR